MKKSLLFLSLLCGLGRLYAQPAWTLKENNYWKFYQYGGLHFDANREPVADTSSLAFIYPSIANPGDYTYCYSSAAVSNRQGELLFYTDAYTVYNKNHEPMPNGTNLLPSNGMDGTMILPVLDNPDQYYIVYMSGEINFFFPSINAYQLHYTKVDMSLNGGLGDVVTGQKNILIADQLSNQLRAIPGDDCNIWIVTHDLDSARFKTFELNSSGISTTPVVSDVGNGHMGMLSFLSFLGMMDVSHDRSKIAFTQNGGDLVPILELYDFNPGTGSLTNPVVLDTLSFLALVSPMCFSPDNSKLYMAINKPHDNSYWHFLSSLYQYDLAAGTPINIRDSKVLISDSVSSVNLTIRLGPDSMIYLPTSYRDDDTLSGFNDYSYGLDENPSNYPNAPNYPFQAYLGRVQNPNAAANSVNFERKAVALQAYSSAAESLGGLFVKPIPGDTSIRTTDIYLCDTGETRMLAPGNAANITYIEWQDGSTATERLIDSPGTYWVISGDYCHYQVDTFVVSRELLDPQITINGFTLGTTRAYDSYQWLREGTPIPGETDDELTVTQNGNYQVVVSNGRCIDTSAMYPVNNVDIGDPHPLAAAVRIYPNPTAGTVHIAAPEKVHIMVMTVEGKLLRQFAHAVEASLEDLAAGLYILHITDTAGRPVLTEKVLKTGK